LHLKAYKFTFVSLFKGFKAKNVNYQGYRTVSAKKETVEKNWVLVDAKGQVLGRLASGIARVIRGKHKTNFTPHMDCGDHVVVVNASSVRMTGRKFSRRVILTHSGYPGGQKEQTPLEIRAKNPARLVEHAVRGMLPKNRLGRTLFRSLHVYAGPEHPHEAQQPTTIKV
jgi:large subunit ribosomal protein L13